MRSCPGLGVVDGGRRTRSYDRLAGPRRIRVGSWNVGSLMRKLLDLCDTLGRHKVDIACFQETKWKGSRAREGNGYKLWYSGSSNARNGIILAGRLKDNVVRVTRRSDRIMAISVVIEGEIANVISAYAPQAGLSDAEKKRFWDALNELVKECPTDQRLIIGGDLNGHFGAAADEYTVVHGGFGFGDRNEEGFKELLSCHEGNQEDIDLVKERYKVAKREAKIAMANAKDKAYKDLYKKLDFKEGANDIYKIAKSRERRRRDIGNVRYIKDEGGRTIVREEDIRKRWGEYFSSLFNENPFDESKADVGRAVGSSSPHMHYECYYLRINQGEAKTALKKMGEKQSRRPRPDSAKIPDEWRLSEVIPIYKNKGDAQACSNYRGIKLLSHTMKLWERVIERRLRSETKVSENQFGFMPGRSTTEAIHLLRSLMEKYRERQRDLHMAFLDLEKAYDSVPQSAEGLNNKLKSWRKALEDNGLRVSREKTEYLRCDFGSLSSHLSLCLPLRLEPSTSMASTFLTGVFHGLLLTCPNHFNLSSLILSTIESTSSSALKTPFGSMSIMVLPQIHLNILNSATSTLVA
nr:retrovirus-related Pol polyprotein LINE-1 [Tanacetum cinerariifolium]